MQGNGGNPDIWKYSKATQFKKGNRGPRGRRKDIHNVAALARTFTREAISTLHEIMKDKTTTASARVAAAVALLDRGWGKPLMAMDVRLNVEVRNLSDVELLQLIAEQRAASTIDVTGDACPGTLLPPSDQTKPNGTGAPSGL
jgi:hypothetical protein